MRCEEVRDALPALARGASGDFDAAAVRAHLATCEECADAWAAIEAVYAARVAAPAGLAERVTAELRRRGAPARRAPRAPLRWAGGLALAAAAVAALVLLRPDDPGRTSRTAVVAEAVASDPFLEPDLLGRTTPVEAELDGMLRVVAQRGGDLPDDIGGVVDEKRDAAQADAAPLADDVGYALGDWPGADGLAAGAATMDDLTLEEMELLLMEMES